MSTHTFYFARPKTQTGQARLELWRVTHHSGSVPEMCVTSHELERDDMDDNVVVGLRAKARCDQEFMAQFDMAMQGSEASLAYTLAALMDLADRGVIDFDPAEAYYVRSMAAGRLVRAAVVAVAAFLLAALFFLGTLSNDTALPIFWTCLGGIMLTFITHTYVLRTQSILNTLFDEVLT